MKMNKELYGTKAEYVYLLIPHYVMKSCLRHMIPSTSFIQGVPKCTKIKRSISGGKA
jgi:hypothetical protein